jgi:hypothetical protein
MTPSKSAVRETGQNGTVMADEIHHALIVATGLTDYNEEIGRSFAPSHRSFGASRS